MQGAENNLPAADANVAGVNLPAQQVSVDASAFGAKFQSKKEVYRFLTHDCGAYLPSYETVTIFHMRDIVAGKRTKLIETKIKHINIPQFEGLTVEKFLVYAADKPAVMKALPLLERERLKMPRGYIANVIYTLVGEEFKKQVDLRVNQRHEERRQEEGRILMDPEIFNVFNSSHSTSGKYNIYKSTEAPRVAATPPSPFGDSTSYFWCIQNNVTVAQNSSCYGSSTFFSLR
jgi:hypothetical protein